MSATWSCPMHPEVESDQAGSCPKCGMALERVLVARPAINRVAIPGRPASQNVSPH